LEEVAELLFVFIGLWRVPGDVGGFPFEEVRNVDAVFLVLVGEGEDVGALKGLGEEAENVCFVSFLFSVFRF
jgi:hypothetical protein